MTDGSQPNTMRAAVIVAPGQIELRAMPMPMPGPGQVRVRLEGCGVCASNVPVWEGREWFTYPLEPGVPGHEGWGRIDALGEGVMDLAEGDHVGLLSQRAFAEFDVADAAHIVKLPEGLKDRPFPPEPLGCAVNVFERSNIHAGQTVAVVGIGFLGALLVRMAKLKGARVFAISRRRSSLEQARDWGADEILQIGDPASVQSRIGNLTGGDGCDRVIEAAGHQQPLDLAGELVRVRGRLIIAGYHQDGLRQVNLQSWNWRGIDVINAHERDEAVYIQGMQEAARMVERGELEIEPLLTHAAPLSELAAALEMARTRPEGFFKAIVRTNGKRERQ